MVVKSNPLMTKRNYSCSKLLEYQNLMTKIEKRDYAPRVLEHLDGPEQYDIPELHLSMEKQTEKEKAESVVRDRMLTREKKYQLDQQSSRNSYNTSQYLKSYSTFNKYNFALTNKSSLSNNHTLSAFNLSDVNKSKIQSLKNYKTQPQKYDNFIYKGNASVLTARSKNTFKPFENRPVSTYGNLKHSVHAKSATNILICTDGSCDFKRTRQACLQKSESRKWFKDMLVDKKELELRSKLDSKMFEDPQMTRVKASNNLMRKKCIQELIELTIQEKFKLKLYNTWTRHHDSEVKKFKKLMEEYQKENESKLRWMFVLKQFRTESLLRSNKVVNILSNNLQFKERYHFKESYDTFYHYLRNRWAKSKKTNLLNLYQFYKYLNADVRKVLQVEKKELQNFDHKIDFNNVLRMGMFSKLHALSKVPVAVEAEGLDIAVIKRTLNDYNDQILDNMQFKTQTQSNLNTLVKADYSSIKNRITAMLMKKSKIPTGNIATFFLGKYLNHFEKLLVDSRIPMLTSSARTDVSNEYYFGKYFSKYKEYVDFLETIKASAALSAHFKEHEFTYVYYMIKTFNDYKTTLNYEDKVKTVKQQQVKYILKNKEKINEVHNRVLVEKSTKYYQGRYAHKEKLQKEYHFEYAKHEYPWQVLVSHIQMDDLCNYRLPEYPFLDDLLVYINRDVKEFKAWPRLDYSQQQLFFTMYEKDFVLIINFWLWFMNQWVFWCKGAISKFEIGVWVDAGCKFYKVLAVMWQSFLKMVMEHDELHSGVPESWFLDDSRRTPACKRTEKGFLSINNENGTSRTSSVNDKKISLSLTRLEHTYDFKKIMHAIMD